MSDRLTAFKELIQAGGAKRPADLIIKNGQLVNVMTAEIYPAEVAIYQGKIVAVDPDVSDYQGTETRVIDAKQQYIVPGLIDGHIHVECSKLSMTSFAEAVVPHGTTSIISGLDEYISVIGVTVYQKSLKKLINYQCAFSGARHSRPLTRFQLLPSLIILIQRSKRNCKNGLTFTAFGKRCVKQLKH